MDAEHTKVAEFFTRVGVAHTTPFILLVTVSREDIVLPVVDIMLHCIQPHMLHSSYQALYWTMRVYGDVKYCLLYTSDAADE